MEIRGEALCRQYLKIAAQFENVRLRFIEIQYASIDGNIKLAAMRQIKRIIKIMKSVKEEEKKLLLLQIYEELKFKFNNGI